MSVKIKRILLVFLLIPLWMFLRSVYRDRIPAFGCFDDCFNFMGGYFLLSGKRLFSEIFFNHMPLMAYISAAIQYVTKPESIYMLVYEHRMALIYFFAIADAILVLRFGLAGFGFALLYESTKGFLFGERFLAESIIVYPLVYVFGLALLRKQLNSIELFLSALFTWFVVFTREPYVPLALFFFGTIVWLHRKLRFAWIVAGTFVLASVATVFYFGVGDFIFNVFTVNIMTATKEVSLTAIFLYPIQLFVGGTWNVFRQIEAALMVLLVTSLFVLRKTKNIKQIAIFLIVIFTLANVRAVAPGSLYYSAFHHTVWYGLLVFIVAKLALQGDPLQRIVFGAIVLFAFLSPESYLHEKVDRQTEFTTNYGNYYVVGEVVRRLSEPKDSLFLDEWDDLIYWQAKRLSPYPYTWYTSVMPHFEKYRQAREHMFATNPPTFYYGKCSGDPLKPARPSGEGEPFEADLDYIRLLQNGKPSCLWIHRDKLANISEDQWRSVEEFQYSQVSQ